MKSRKINFLKLIVFITLILIPSLVNAQASKASQQKTIKSPKIEIRGEIEETSDYFGRARYIGKVINREKVRIDFIKIELVLRNRIGEIIGKKTEFIKGQTHQFYDFEVSRSSLGGGRTGSFNIIIDIPAENVFSYSYKITGKHYLYR
ncbi:MAG: hypothetical protein GY863_02000 [bacterium]|nr:hypothetical protein [bacterium]